MDILTNFVAFQNDKGEGLVSRIFVLSSLPFLARTGQ